MGGKYQMHTNFENNISKVSKVSISKKLKFSELSSAIINFFNNLYNKFSGEPERRDQNFEIILFSLKLS